MACRLGHKDVVKLILKYGKAKGIEIQKSSWFLYSIVRLGDSKAKEIESLLDEYHQSVITETFQSQSFNFPWGSLLQKSAKEVFL